MNDEPRFLLDSASSGVYATPAEIDALQRQAAACGLAAFDLDLAGVADKSAFLLRCRDALGFPPSFGHNWDALADSLADFSWRPARGYIVLWRRGREFALRSPADLGTALAVFAGAADYWREKGKPFLTLLDTESTGGRVLAPPPG